MSVASLDLNIHKKSFHRRNNSGELDVFEAANYFSCHKNEENFCSVDRLKFSKEASSTACSKQQIWKQSAGARLSLDIPTRKTEARMPESTQNQLVRSQFMKEKIVKNKQPSSPGGRLASFLNSLFAASKKKKKSGQDDQRPRMRRSSISHVDSKSVYSGSSSADGFRTPPPHTQTRNYKSFSNSRSCLDQKQVILTLPKQVTDMKNEVKFIKTSLEIPSSDKIRRNSTSGLVVKETIPVDKNEGFEFKKVDVAKDFDFRKVDVAKDFEEDDGAESDTSSDLFELQNYDLGDFSSNELPVYETTNFQQIMKNHQN